ncbi:MAG TPA: hypothetical protein VI300_12760 [Solirubrobacter sp.]
MQIRVSLPFRVVLPAWIATSPVHGTPSGSLTRPVARTRRLWRVTVRDTDFGLNRGTTMVRTAVAVWPAASTATATIVLRPTSPTPGRKSHV